MRPLNRHVRAAAVLACLALAAPVGAQQSQQGTTTPRGATEPPVLENAVTLIGCVYQAADEPTTFALRGRHISAQGESQPVARADSGVPGAAGTAGTTGVEGAWYRLSATGERNLDRHVGEPVTITGELEPGRDEKGTEVVVHRLEPGKVTVTTVDLRPAPQLEIHSISPSSGSCE